MELALVGPLRRTLLLAAVLLVAGMPVYFAAKISLAERLSASSRVEDWERAAQLEPGNFRPWTRLGWFYHYDIEQFDLRRAVANYQRGLEANARSVLLRMELAAAYEAGNEPARAREAYEQALRHHPISSEVRWKYGNFLVRQGELTEAFAEIRRALEWDSSRARLAVSVCWRASGDAERILKEALPRQQHSYMAALEYFLADKNVEASLAAWKYLLALHEPVDVRRVLPLAEELLRRKRFNEARQVWEQALVTAGWEQAAAPGELVWDGGFERDALNAGFGWRVVPVEGATTEFDSQVYHSPARSLRVRFDGTENLDFQHVVQYVLVEPGQRYRFEGYLRTEGLSTDSGIRFWIHDPHNPAGPNLYTPNVLGTQPWSLEQADIVAGPTTRVLAIGLRRLMSQKINSRIRGTVWVDDVSLRSAPGARAFSGGKQESLTR